MPTVHGVVHGLVHGAFRRAMAMAEHAAIFHFGTGHHHIVGLKAAEDGADKVKPGGEILFCACSFAYDKAEAVAQEPVRARPFGPAADYKLKVFPKRV